MHPLAGTPGGAPQPGVPAHAAPAFPHAMHAGWLHVGGDAGEATVNTVLIPSGKGRAKPSAVANGVAAQLPCPPPQSASEVHVPKRFCVAFVWQSLGPFTETS